MSKLTPQQKTLEESLSKESNNPKLKQITFTIAQLSSYLTVRQNKSTIDLPLTIDS